MSPSEELPVGRDHVLDVRRERVLRRQPVVQGDAGNPGSDRQARGEAERRPGRALTPAGESAVSRAEPAWQAAIQEILGGAVTPEELTALSLALGTLRSDLERRHPGLPAG